MTQNLVAINAALRLGDKVLPPEGAVCRFRTPYPGSSTFLIDKVLYVAEILECLFDKANAEDFAEACLILRYMGECPSNEGPELFTKDGDTLIADVRWLDSVVELPEDVPPFEEWKRWK